MEKYNDIGNEKTNFSDIIPNNNKSFQMGEKIKLINLKKELEEKKKKLYTTRFKLRKNEKNNLRDLEICLKKMIGTKNLLKMDYEKFKDNFENQKIRKKKKLKKLENLNNILKKKLKSWKYIQEKTSEKTNILSFFKKIKKFF